GHPRRSTPASGVSAISCSGNLVSATRRRPPNSPHRLARGALPVVQSSLVHGHRIVTPNAGTLMPRFIFPEWTETLKRWINLLVLGAPVYLVALVAYAVTPEAIRIGYQPDQPVPYSHALHAGELGLDCRY